MKLKWSYGVPKHFFIICILTVSASFFVQCTKKSGPVQQEKTAGTQAAKGFKILHIMSYHSPWKWTDDQFNGFKEGLKDQDVEYKVLQMDTNNSNTTTLQKERTAREFLQVIDSWQPDLVYTTDDDIQQFLGIHMVDSHIPYVFSGVNNPVSAYGFEGSQNIAGVLEGLHFIPGVKLLQSIKPSIKRIAVITTPGVFWDSVVETIKQEDAADESFEIVTIDFVESYPIYQKKMKEYEGAADAVCLLGIFNFKDSLGNNVSFDEVLIWTTRNSSVPDFSFWRDRVEKGTFCAMTVSGYEQGLAAGKIARGILVDGKSPASFTFKSTVKGEPVINLARAKKLGITLQSDTLLTAEILDSFAWEGNDYED